MRYSIFKRYEHNNKPLEQESKITIYLYNTRILDYHDIKFDNNIISSCNRKKDANQAKNEANMKAKLMENGCQIH